MAVDSGRLDWRPCFRRKMGNMRRLFLTGRCVHSMGARLPVLLHLFALIKELLAVLAPKNGHVLGGVRAHLRAHFGAHRALGTR